MSKRNGTRSTRMERPLSKTEKEKVRASLSGEGLCTLASQRRRDRTLTNAFPAGAPIAKCAKPGNAAPRCPFFGTAQSAWKDNSDGY
ncbi:hypothetical protein PSAB6_190096 [Paraburkholderia sabiae]|nr:hypothetical protein PSAB6_190096 [Paraburkholderia sabiae]